MKTKDIQQSKVEPTLDNDNGKDRKVNKGKDDDRDDDEPKDP